MLKITGLDSLQKELREAQRALANLDGELVRVAFDPFDPASIETAIRSMNQTIDERVRRYSTNAIVGPMIEEMKEKYRHGILEKAAQSRLQEGKDA